jgi:hypothetical protein
MAKKVRFKRDYDVPLSTSQIVAYKRGDEPLLTDGQAEQAIADGAAELMDDKTPAKKRASDDEAGDGRKKK